MESKYWLDKWQAKDIQFHREIPNVHLVSYFEKLKPRKIVVPLCGKSLDMLWLRKTGHEVMGFELSPLACEAFFQENQIPVQKSIAGEGTLYQTDKLAIWCGDIFQSPDSLWKGTASIYDRAALVALPSHMRRSYAKLLGERAGKGTTYLLITYVYQSDKELGPPFSVSEKEVRDLFEKDFSISRLHSGKENELSGRPGKFAETEVNEMVFELLANGR